MKWGPFIILALLTIALQTTFVPRLRLFGVFPDLMFILAVHYALWGRWPDAAIAAWLLGAIFGNQSLDLAALYAFTYGAAAWAIIQVRQGLFRDHVLTQIFVTLIFCLAVQLIVGFYHRLVSPGPVSDIGIWMPALLVSVYTAACTPPIHWLLVHLAGRWTGLASSKRFKASR